MSPLPQLPAHCWIPLPVTLRRALHPCAAFSATLSSSHSLCLLGPPPATPLLSLFPWPFSFAHSFSAPYSFFISRVPAYLIIPGSFYILQKITFIGIFSLFINLKSELTSVKRGLISWVVQQFWSSRGSLGRGSFYGSSVLPSSSLCSRYVASCMWYPYASLMFTL